MTNLYNKKKNLWIKIAFILLNHGGEEKTMQKRDILKYLALYFPLQAPTLTALTVKIKLHNDKFLIKKLKKDEFEVMLIDEEIESEHEHIFSRWKTKTENPP